MRTFLIFLFVAVVSLIVYNPDMNDFRDYLETTEHEAQLEEQTSIINQMFTREAGAAVQQGKPVTMKERNNFFIFSTYKLSLSDEEGFLDPMERTFLGIGSMFFELGSSNAPMDQLDELP